MDYLEITVRYHTIDVSRSRILLIHDSVGKVPHSSSTKLIRSENTRKKRKQSNLILCRRFVYESEFRMAVLINSTTYCIRLPNIKLIQTNVWFIFLASSLSEDYFHFFFIVLGFGRYLHVDKL